MGGKMHTLGHFEAGAGNDGVGGEGTTGPLQLQLISMEFDAEASI